MNKEINQLRFIEFLLCPEFLINTLTVLSHLTLKIFSDIGIFTISISQMKKLRYIDAKNLTIFWKLNKIHHQFNWFWFQNNLSFDFSAQFNLPQLWSLCRHFLLCENCKSFLKKKKRIWNFLNFRFYPQQKS